MTDAISRTPKMEDIVTVQAQEALLEPPTGEVVMTLRDVAVAFAGRTAVRDVTFDVHGGFADVTPLGLTILAEKADEVA